MKAVGVAVREVVVVLALVADDLEQAQALELAQDLFEAARRLLAPADDVVQLVGVVVRLGVVVVGDLEVGLELELVELDQPAVEPVARDLDVGARVAQRQDDRRTRPVRSLGGRLGARGPGRLLRLRRLGRLGLLRRRHGRRSPEGRGFYQLRGVVSARPRLPPRA